MAAAPRRCRNAACLDTRDAVNATAATDFVLAAVALAFALLLARSWPAHWIWVLAFAFVTAAAVAGGVFHAGAHTAALWNATLVLIGVAMVLFIAASLAGGLPAGAPHTNWIIAGAVVTAIGFGLQRSPLRVHNVAYHLVQIAGLYLFYRGARL